MKYLIILLTLPPLTIIGQEMGPNDKVKAMGLTDDHIETLCAIASGGGRLVFTQWGLHEPMFEKWIYFEGVYNPENLLKLGGFKDMEDFKKNANRETLVPIIKTLWETKYSYCYCQINRVIAGTLDMIALYNEKPDWAYKIYSNDGVNAEGINKIRFMHYPLKKKGTLLDYIYDVTIEEPNSEVSSNPNYASSLKHNIKMLRASHMGAKRMKEMTPEEIEENSN